MQIDRLPQLTGATLVLAFSGWMDGGDVSTGTVSRLVELSEAVPIARLDPEPFYIYSFPGSMELTALFRPHVEIENGLTTSLSFPQSEFYCHEPANLVFFLGKEPHMNWRLYRDCLFRVAARRGCQTNPLRRLLRRGDASYAGTEIVCHLFRCLFAARDGTVWGSAHELYGPRLLHQLSAQPRHRPPDYR